MKTWHICLAGATFLAMATWFALPARPQAISFDRLRDAQTALRAAGYHCTSDNTSGHIDTGFLLSREATSWNGAGALRKSGAMGPEWKGKVWVTITPSGCQLETIPDGAGTRVWGTVVAFGDKDLLDEIDDALTQSIF